MLQVVNLQPCYSFSLGLFVQEIRALKFSACLLSICCNTFTNNIPICSTTAAPPSQPERPCLYYNGTHIVLCAELPFSHLLITVFNISLTTTCDEMYHDSIVATDLCEPIPVSDIVKMTDDCQLANVTITAQSDAGESQPSPPATVNSKFVILSYGIDGIFVMVVFKLFCL